MWLAVIVQIIVGIVIQLNSIENSNASEQNALPTKLNNNAHCIICHTTAAKDDIVIVTSDAPAVQINKDLNAICLSCHSRSYGHGIDNKPLVNRNNLPLNSDGKISCAITCHNMHARSSDLVQSRYYLRLPASELCLSCHIK